VWNQSLRDRLHTLMLLCIRIQGALTTRLLQFLGISFLRTLFDLLARHEHHLFALDTDRTWLRGLHRLAAHENRCRQ
jgi:hypothetical protein